MPKISRQRNLYEEGMSVSTETLMRAKESGLLIKWVPITILNDIKDRFIHNRLSHDMGVIYSVMQIIYLRHHLVFCSLPGIALFIAAAFYMNRPMELYFATKYISTNMITVSVGTAVVGVVLSASGVILLYIKCPTHGKKKRNIV